MHICFQEIPHLLIAAKTDPLNHFFLQDPAFKGKVPSNADINFYGFSFFRNVGSPFFISITVTDFTGL